MDVGRLFWKFLLAFWLALIVAGVGVGFVVSLYHQTREPVDLDSGPRAGLMVAAAAASLQHGGPDALHALMSAWREFGDADLHVVDASGREITGRPLSPAALTQARALARADAGGRHARVVALPGRGEYLLFVAAREGLPGMPPLAGARRPSPPGMTPVAGERPPPGPPANFRPFPLFPIVIGLLASLGFSTLLAWYLARPIRHLRDAFDAVAAGRLDTRVGHLMKRRDEIADLGRNFDHMAQQLQLQIAAQHRLLHDVSHELRSPLARLQAAIGLARQDPEKLMSSLERVERESIRLDRLVDELLTLSRLEAGGNGDHLERVDLVELVAAIADDARFEANGLERDVRFSGSGEVLAEVRAELLHRAFENVIRNAVKYTPAGTRVEVTAETPPGQGAFVVTVADHGAGVPTDDLATIFEPFYRAAGSQDCSGFGLGLAIARRAIEAHGGSIRAVNLPQGGLRVEMRLPLTDARAA